MRVQKTLHLHLELEKARPKCKLQEYYMFEKYDGWYGFADLGVGTKFNIQSRSCRIIPSMEEFSNMLTHAVPRCKGRLIFEIMIPDTEFAILNGILNRKYSQAESAYIMVHDFVPFDSELPFVERYKLAQEIVEYCDNESIRIAEILGVSDQETIWRSTVQGVWDKGGEGLILKRSEAPYDKAVRNYDLMKIKEELTLDLLVVGLEEGKGKYIDTTGALILLDSFKTLHTVSGMSDIERKLWWANRGEIVGKVVEVKAMKVLPDGQLREPRFIAIRHDKTKKEID